MPSFAYQSFESSSSKTHDARAIFQRNFTRKTSKRLRDEDVDVLLPPVDLKHPSTIFEGPAKKAKIEALDHKAPPVISMIQTHIAQIFRNGFSTLGENLSALVCGELDASTDTFDPMHSYPGLRTYPFPAKKNCQSFTAFVNKTAMTTAVLVTGASYCVVHIDGLTVAFVHVPNAICKDLPDASAFYGGIYTAIRNEGGPGIDMVVGDTNQQKFDFTRDCLNNLGIGTFAIATKSGVFSPIGTYAYTATGTNSGGDKMYDVCVYNTSRVKDVTVHNLTQASSGTVVTDHMGILVKASAV